MDFLGKLSDFYPCRYDFGASMGEGPKAEAYLHFFDADELYGSGTALVCFLACETVVRDFDRYSGKFRVMLNEIE